MTKPETPPTPKTPFDTAHATLAAYWDELARFENAAYERAKATTADFAKLANDAIVYASQLSAEWRKLSLETTKRITETFAKS